MAAPRHRIDPRPRRRSAHCARSCADAHTGCWWLCPACWDPPCVRLGASRAWSRHYSRALLGELRPVALTSSARSATPGTPPSSAHGYRTAVGTPTSCPLGSETPCAATHERIRGDGLTARTRRGHSQRHAHRNAASQRSASGRRHPGRRRRHSGSRDHRGRQDTRHDVGAAQRRPATTGPHPAPVRGRPFIAQSRVPRTDCVAAAAVCTAGRRLPRVGSRSGRPDQEAPRSGSTRRHHHGVRSGQAGRPVRPGCRAPVSYRPASQSSSRRANSGPASS